MSFTTKCTMLEYHILKRYKYLYWEADKCTGLMDRIKTNLSVWMAAMADRD